MAHPECPPAVLEAAGHGHLPVCLAKTQSSLSDNPRRVGVPHQWTLTVTDAHLSAGGDQAVTSRGTLYLSRPGRFR